LSIIKETNIFEPKEPKKDTKRIIIGSIENEINIIRDNWRETKECSESYIRYYETTEQLPTVVNFISKEKETMPFTSNLYFGCYCDRLKEPFRYWEDVDCYISPNKIQDLLYKIQNRKLIQNNKFILDINEISENIFAYRDGFKLGYESFDQLEINEKLGDFKTEKRTIERIINYIERHKQSANNGFTFSNFCNLKKECRFRRDYKVNEFYPDKNGKILKYITCSCSELPWWGNLGEPPCLFFNFDTLPPLNDWKIRGIEEGKYFKAWFRVLANYQIFDEYFRETENIKLQHTDKSKPELSINQIALKFVYEGFQITRENGNEIAKKYGHNSGEKLFQKFTYYSSPTNRKGKPIPYTPKKLNNKIQLIESVIELLSTDIQERAKDEVKILKAFLESDYQ
jgi:hypothetical protein